MKTIKHLLIIFISLLTNVSNSQNEIVYSNTISNEIVFYNKLPKEILSEISTEKKLLEKIFIEYKNRSNDSLKITLLNRSNNLRNKVQSYFSNFSIEKTEEKDLKKLTFEELINRRRIAFFCLDLSTRRKVNASYKNYFTKSEVKNGMIYSYQILAIQRLEDFKNPAIIKLAQIDTFILKKRNNIIDSQNKISQNILIQYFKLEKIKNELSFMDRMVERIERYINTKRCANGFSKKAYMEQKELYQNLKIEKLSLENQIDFIEYFIEKDLKKLSDQEIINVQNLNKLVNDPLFLEIPNNLIKLK